MVSPQLNKVQVSILYSLRHAQSERYSDLMHPTGLESDNFKFYIRSLMKLGLIEKWSDGTYALTTKGKEFANNLDREEGVPQKQPKLTLRICVSRQGPGGKTEYLFQERQRNPYWGYWDMIGGPVLWGEAIEDTAARELRKQTGLRASFTVKAFYRVRDFAEQAEVMLEDKLFAVLTAEDYEGEITNTWQGGRNVWMTVSELLQTKCYFSSTPKMIAQLEAGPFYIADDLEYAPDEY